MRIAQIMLAKQFGGAERSFVDLSVALAARGHQVLAIVEQRSVASKFLKGKAGIELQKVRCRGVWDWLCRARMQRCLVKFMPELTHTHLARAALLGGAAARAYGIPTVAKTHNLVDLKYYKNIDVLVPTTREQQRYLLSQGIAESAQMLIPNFCAMEPPECAPVSRTPATSISIKTLGRFVYKKGFDLLLRAFAMLLDDGMDVELTLGGDGPEVRQLRSLAGVLGVGHRVTFSGWVDDVQKFLSDAQLFVLPSRDEPFGIVLLEAMACGVPIVSTRASGPNEILDENTAFFADLDDAEQLAETIKRAIHNPDEAKARAEKALRRFSETYHVDKVVSRYVELYTQLLGRAHDIAPII